MDSIIPLGQKNTLAEYMILSGADNHPPMLDKDLYDSWKCRILVVPVFSLGYDPIACLNKAMTFLIVVASLRRQDQSYFGFGYKSNATSSGGNNTSRQLRIVKCYNCQEAGQILDEEQLAFLADPGVPDGEAVQTIIPNNAAFQTEDLDTYYVDCDDISNEKAILMAKISNYGSDVILEVPHSETYLNDMENQSVHAMQDFEQTPVMDVTDNEITSYQNPFYLKKAQRIKPTLYDGIVISTKHVAMSVIDDEETLILDEKSRSKMSEKEKDPETIKQNISHKPIDYEELNRLSKDFGKRFTPQQELSAEQAFWLRISNPTIESFNIPPVKVEVPSELPNKRTTPDARTKDLLNEIMEVQTVFNQMDVAVQQSLVDKQYLEIAKRELLLEND
ncbi:hypothetical protein Tco_1012507 [Tanacetum coccineum]